MVHKNILLLKEADDAVLNEGSLVNQSAEYTVSFFSHLPDCRLRNKSNTSDDASDENGNLMWHERNKKLLTQK